MSDVQRIDTGIFYILVGVNMRMSGLSEVGVVIFASSDNIIDGHYDSLFI